MRVDYYLPPVPLEEVSTHVRRAQRFGYDGFLTAETNHDPFLPLSLAAVLAPGLELGTGIAVAFARSPTVVAHTAWDLARASGGKFMLGLGTQVRAHLTRRFSVPWTPPAPRLREYVLALRTIWDAWQHGGPLRFTGDHYQLSLMTPFFDPGPIDHPRVPVFTAGVGRVLIRLAGEVCDGFHLHPFHTVRYVDDVVLPGLAAGAASAGRSAGDVALSGVVFVATGKTDAQISAAREAVRRQVAFYASTPSYRPVLDLHGWEFGRRLSFLAGRGQWHDLAEVIDDAALDAVAVCGPPDEIGPRLRERYRGRLQRIGLYGAGPGLTPGLDDSDWEGILAALRETPSVEEAQLR